MAVAIRCKHCNRAANGRRGLCNRCWRDFAIRRLYPAGRGGGDTSDHSGDMTEAELDALIAEQLRPENLPDWWERDARMQQTYGMMAGLALLMRRGRL